MKAQADFKELLELFNAHEVEYVIVGGYALAFHGAPRFTGDMDILINPSVENYVVLIHYLRQRRIVTDNSLQKTQVCIDTVVALN